MSHEEDLIDYSDEELQAETATGPTATAGAGANGAAKGASSGEKGGHVGVHATSFRDFLLRPELLRALTDCGFEHPSEG